MTILGLPREGRFDFRMKSWLERLAREVVYAPLITSLSNSDITMLGGGTATSGAGELLETTLGSSGIVSVWCWFTVNLTSVAGTTGITLPLSKEVATTPNATSFPFFSGVGSRTRFLRAIPDVGAPTFSIFPTSYDDSPNDYSFFTGAQSFNGVFYYKVA